MVVHARTIRDASIVALSGIDNVRACFAAKDLEWKMLSVALGARAVTDGNGVGV